MYRFAAIVVTLSALISGIVIPVLELNETHLFNPDLPAHARLHEAWQLMTNSALSALAVFLIWSGRAPRLAIILSLLISVPFLLAFAASATYGGSMLHSDGTQLAVWGMNLGVLVALIMSSLLLLSLALFRPAEPETQNQATAQ
ncbi:hypothetical protein [Parasphingorhabdus flavimaris]|uniref:hypothetical protein n=1 Tax=Parasphingorhabdus flavimaris TaxID=266812 RepID=UPI003001D07E